MKQILFDQKKLLANPLCERLLADAKLRSDQKLMTRILIQLVESIEDLELKLILYGEPIKNDPQIAESRKQVNRERSKLYDIMKETLKDIDEYKEWIYKRDSRNSGIFYTLFDK